jgi:hypothetical protein
MTIRKELIDELIASSGGKSLIGPDGLVKELTKARCPDRHSMQKERRRS